MRSATYYPQSQPRVTTAERVLLAGVSGLALFFALLLAGFIGFQLFYAGRILPGVRVGGVNVGGLTVKAAAAKVTAQSTYSQTGRILLRYRDQVQLASPAELGMFLDPEATARAAYSFGRNGGPFRRINQQLESLSAGAELAPALIFDQRMAYNVIAGLAEKINQPTVEASLRLNGTEVVIQPGQVGRAVDVPASLSLLSKQLQSLTDGVVELAVVETPPLIVDLSTQAETVRAILSKPFTLRMPDGQPDEKGPWRFDPDSLATMLTFERADGPQGATVQVALRRDVLASFLNDLAPKLQLDPENTRFTFNDDTRKLEVIKSAVIGRRLDVEASAQAMQDNLLKGQHSATLAFRFTDPPVTDSKTGDDLGITQLVHAETSYFYGSTAPRVQNIQAAASRFHGLLVAPGETFSMASALGNISLDNGYAEAVIIVGDRSVKGVGGGVCQVSTTLFRAAFFAGFPIVERHAHAYRVYYYEKVAGNRIDPRLSGLDATVYVPLVDFKFTNDTPYWLLMETYVNPATSSITWKFYSTADNRKVDWETTGPTNVVDAPKPIYKENPDLAKDEIKQVDWSADGADVTVNRIVYRDGVVWLQDTFITHYQPWTAVYEYGPGTALPDDAK